METLGNNKMKRIVRISFFGLLALASCTKEMNVSDPGTNPNENGFVPEEGMTIVSAGIGSTKTTMNSTGDLFWSATDAIQINGVNSSSISINPENAARADFKLEANLKLPYCAGYPADKFSGYNPLVDTAMVTIPATQTYVAGTFDPNSAVMLAYASDEKGLSFKTAVAYLKIVVGGGDDSDAIKSVRIRANDGLAFSGPFTAAFGPDVCSLTARRYDFSEITLTATSPVAQETPIYLAIPAQNYTFGFNLFIIDENGHWCEFVTDKAFTASPGAIYTTNVQFNNKGQYQGIGIYTATDWVKFTEAADGNVAVTGEAPLTSSGNGNYDEWKDENGVVNMYADVNVHQIDWSASAIDQRIASISNWSTVFDGHNHTLSADIWRIAAFQNIYPGGVVKNLKVNTENFSVRSSSSYGGNCLLAAYVIGGEINNCENLANITSTSTTHTSMSGICRAIYAGKLVDCTNSGNLILNQPVTAASANVYMGGITAIIGKSLSTYSLGGRVEIIRCTNKGKVVNNMTEYAYPQCYTATGGIAGWLIGGDATNYASLTDCENLGEVRHTTPYATGASNTSSSVGGIIGVAFTPNKTSKVPAGRTIGYMYGGKAFENETASFLQDGFYFEMDGCINRGKIANQHHIHGSVGSGTIRYTVNAGGLIGTAIGMKDKHARITSCKNYGNVVAGNWISRVPRSFCNTVLGGLIGHAGSLDLDGCVFKAYLGDVEEYCETYCTGAIFGSILSNCSASNCKVYVDKLFYKNTASNSFYYYSLTAGMISKWTRDDGAFNTYCSSCSFTNNSFGGHIKTILHAGNASHSADTDITAANIDTYFYNDYDDEDAIVQSYPVSGNTLWNGEE